MRFRRWLNGLTTCVLIFAVKGEALAQQGSEANDSLSVPAALLLGDAALPPRVDQAFLPGRRTAPPSGDATLPPLKDAASLPSATVPSLPDTCPAANIAPAEEGAGASPGWLSGLLLDGEYLFLKPHSQSMDYAITNATNSGVPDGSVVARDWSWRSGMRVGLGYRLPGQPWSVGFYYTYLHDATSGSVAAPDGGSLFATLTHPGTVSEVQTASAATSLNYNVYDVEVGRWCALTNTLAVRFFGGGRFAHIDQNFNAFYDGGDANQDVVSRQLHFNGGGFRAGADAFQNLFWGLSLFGRASASLVGGEFHSTLFETNNAGATTLTNFSDRFEKVVPVAEMTMGLGWQYQNLRLTAGYQFINWFGLVNVPTFADDAHQGKFVRQTSDLSLEGLILRAEWWF